jgi:hypothetical protein
MVTESGEKSLTPVERRGYCANAAQIQFKSKARELLNIQVAAVTRSEVHTERGLLIGNIRNRKQSPKGMRKPASRKGK